MENTYEMFVTEFTTFGENGYSTVFFKVPTRIVFKSDQVPVKMADWAVKENGLACSNCNSEILYDKFNAPIFTEYCPWCGVRMKFFD